MTSLENDMICLIDSLDCLKDDIHQQIQGLEHLADMCLQDDGATIFGKSNGLSVVYKLAFDKKANLAVLQKALLTLGNAALMNDENKGILCTDQTLHFVQGNLLNKNQTVKVIASTTYFLACLCSNNVKAQNKIRKSKCLDRLVDLYRHYHPKGDASSSEVEQWFDKADTNAPVVLRHISHALKSIINKPRNAENQVICSRLLNLALSSALSPSNSDETKIDVLQFVTDCITENETTQRTFSIIGGIRLLSKILGSQIKNKSKKTLLPYVLDTLTIAITDNSDNKNVSAQCGMARILLDCLRSDLQGMVVLKAMMCLSELVHENTTCQQQVLEADGIPVIIDIMSKHQDDIKSKVGTSILQSCVKNASDLSNKDEDLADFDQQENAQTSNLSSLLNFFTGKKQHREEKRSKKHEKSLKTILRSLELSDSSNEHSDKVKELIKSIEKGSMEQNEERNSKKNLRQTVSDQKENSEETTKKTSMDQDMVKMLKEQREMLQNFQQDINNLRAEIASQASECGDSNVMLMNQCLSATPRRTNAAGLILTTPKVGKRNGPICPGSVPVKRYAKQQLQQVTAFTPLRSRAFVPVKALGQGSHSVNRVICTNSNFAPASNLSHLLPVPRISNEEPGDKSSSHDDTFYDAVSNTEHVQYDERPALQKETGRPMYPTHYEQEKRFQNNNCVSAPWLSTSPTFTAPTAFEKVQQWRHNNNQQFEGKLDHEFKIPVVTPSLKRKRGKATHTPLTKSTQSYCASNAVSRQTFYDRKLVHAPKKLLPTKRRRPVSPDEGCEDCMYTPEQGNNWDQTKRVLNFDGYASQRRLGFHQESEATSVDKNTSSGFVETTSGSSSRAVKENMQSNDDIRLAATNLVVDVDVNKCLGCYPFCRVDLLNVNSRNLLRLLKEDPFTCEHHGRFAQRVTSGMKKLGTHVKPVKQRKLMSLKCDEVRNVPMPSKQNWESMSVFSYRSNKEKDWFDDNASQCSGWTVNTLKRRRRQDYTEEEVAYILDGIERYGTRWTAILNSFPFKSGRTADDLRSKYKLMRKQNRSMIATQVKQRPLPFTTQELVNLRQGVSKFGEKWSAILKGYQFENSRTPNELQQKWNVLSKKISLMRLVQ